MLSPGRRRDGYDLSQPFMRRFCHVADRSEWEGQGDWDTAEQVLAGSEIHELGRSGKRREPRQVSLHTRQRPFGHDPGGYDIQLRYRDRLRLAQVALLAW